MAFLYRLESEDGSQIGPPTLRTANRSWRVGDTILFPGRTLRVVEVRDLDADQAPTLVVRDTAEFASGDAA